MTFVYSNLNVPTVTSYPSPTCLQWSADGQLYFVTKTAVYILSPKYGINFVDVTNIKASPKDSNEKFDWFKTVIQPDRTASWKWLEHSQEWGAVSLGSLDVNICSVAFSPSGLSSNAGCIVATLSTNMDLTLWTATKNCLQGEWIKVSDVIPTLLETYPSQPNPTINAQITSILWTPQADFGLEPAPFTDASLFICGNRAGSLIFLKYNKEHQSVDVIESLSISDKWITQISFSSWTPSREKSCEGYVAYGTSDGSVGVINLKQTLQQRSSSLQLLPEYNVQFECEKSPELLHEADRSFITALKWVSIPSKGFVLVHCRPGVIHLRSFLNPELGWSGSKSFVLQTQKTSTPSSAFHQITGINHVPRKDVLIMTLFDGSFHALHNFSSEPSWTLKSVGDEITSERLSKEVRSIFVNTQPEQVDKNDANRITGVISYDDSATFLWAQEAWRPNDFSYKHDAKHSSILITARLWQSDHNIEVLQRINEVLFSTSAGSGIAPLYLLRPFLLELSDEHKINVILPQLLELLEFNIDEKPEIIIPMTEQIVESGLKLAFRQSMTMHLFGWNSVFSFRMRLSLADFAWKLSDSEQKRVACGQVAQRILNAISNHVLLTLVRHLIAVVDSLAVDDLPFISRLITQATMPGVPEDLLKDGTLLLTRTKSLFSQHGSEFCETCPACNVEIPFENTTSAACRNGHNWGRCSITTFILATSSIRTCLGCSRKAFQPCSASQWLPKVISGWTAQEYLEAVQRCIFCGNSFISVL